VNFVTLIVSILSFYLLLGVERGHVPFPLYLWTVYGLTAFFLGYFALRLGLRFYLGRHLKEFGPFDVPVATSNPFVWMLLSEVKAEGQMRTVYGTYRWGKGLTEGPTEVFGPMEREPERVGPVADRAEALRRSYPLARQALRALDDTYHFAEAAPEAGGWSVTWYSLEFVFFGRAMAVRVAFDASGGSTVRRRWYRPAHPLPG
jgi:hypothetical protein